MKTISIITLLVSGFIIALFPGCAPVPKGQMQFESYLAHEKIPLTCNLIIPEPSRNYHNKSMGIKFTIGPLFAENVPIALREITNEVSTSSGTASDMNITAHLNDFSISMAGLFPVVNATVTYELSATDELVFNKLASTQSYKSSLFSPEGPELYKMVILECLKDLNSQLIENKSFIILKTKG